MLHQLPTCVGWKFFGPAGKAIQIYSMNTQVRRADKMLLILALLWACRFGAEPVSAQPAAQKPATNAPMTVKFRPQTTGAASVRVTGGSRGTGDAAITLDVLAPDGIGTTTQEQPSLFWFQSKPADAKFELTLLQENKVKPLMQVKVEHSSKAGIQRLKLSDHGVKLNPGVEYQWVVALVTDPDNRSTDLVASGVIKRVPPGADLKERISQATPAALANLYADAGIWYDALAAVSDQIEAQPKNKSLRQTRAELLRQVGLNTAAQSEVSK
jgi:Domain of Unknown Function (DUF928)